MQSKIFREWIKVISGNFHRHWDLDSQPSDPVIVFHFQTRENFNASRDDIKALSKKMLEVRQVVSTAKIDALGTLAEPCSVCKTFVDS